MQHSLVVGRARTEANGLRRDSQAVRSGSHGPRSLTKSDRVAVSTLVRDVMARVGLTQKAMAQNAAITESMLSEALAPHGTRHLAMEWLLDQDDDFLIVLLEQITVLRGLTDQARRDVKAARVSELVRLILECA
jgi:sulfur transfer complex TusBCD TusB component (DsrH family)